VLVTAIDGRLTSSQEWSKFMCVAPFSTKEQSPIYFSEDRSRTWAMLSTEPKIEGDKALSLNAGISCIVADSEEENKFYLCNSHGIFKTTDNGKSYRLVKGVEN